MTHTPILVFTPRWIKNPVSGREISCAFPLSTGPAGCIGALQSLNKHSGDFTEDDLELLTFISNYVTIALENMRYVEELKDLNKAMERAMNHLSHELRTPMALHQQPYSTVFSRTFRMGTTRNRQG